MNNPEATAASSSAITVRAAPAPDVMMMPELMSEPASAAANVMVVPDDPFGGDQGEGAATGFEMDPELLQAFAAESAELLQQSEAVLLELEAHPDDRERLNTVFRCFHTIKGTSSFLGLDRIGGVAHRAESLLALAREGTLRLTDGYADLVLASMGMPTSCSRRWTCWVRWSRLRRANRRRTQHASLHCSMISALPRPVARPHTTGAHDRLRRQPMKR
jgi:HPt (histidine-containing phosphotransfer) domain-containing protein